MGCNGTRTATLLAILGVFAASAATAQVSPVQHTAPRRIFLNGSAIDDVRDVTLVDVRVTIGPTGDVLLSNPAYDVVRRPGRAAQVVRRAEGPPAQGRLYLVSQRKGSARTPFSVVVVINGKQVASIDGSSERTSQEVTSYFFQGVNVVRLQAVPGASSELHAFDPNASLTLTLGAGVLEASTLAIHRVLLTYERNGLEQGRWLEEHDVVVGSQR